MDSFMLKYEGKGKKKKKSDLKFLKRVVTGYRFIYMEI